MAMKVIKPTVIPLRDIPQFSEMQLHQEIADNPSILGLGDLTVLQRERPQPLGGRLDMLMWDEEAGCRFEVEIMLGATDPSHIIRCIEYWDVERRRYPAYDHVAVLVAEDITSRFLNVMSLLAGSIPLIAIQSSALKLDENTVALHFTKVLDQRALREDDTTEETGVAVDRNFWVDKVGQELLAVCDRVLAYANEKLDGKATLKYLKGQIRVEVGGAKISWLYFYPKKAVVKIGVRHPNVQEVVTLAEKADLDAQAKKNGTIALFALTPAELDKNEALLRDVVQKTAEEAVK